MRRWVVVVGLVGLMAFVVVGLVLTFVPKLRREAAEAGCANNLREMTLFAAHHFKPQPNVPAGKLLNEIPAGTIVLPGVAPDDRLSWVVAALPGFDQKRQNLGPLLAAIDRTKPWAADANQQAAKMRVLALLCPGNPPDIAADAPAPTQYVGIAGLGADAATLALRPPAPAPPRAGCFRYDAPTPFAAIADGLSQTLLFGERSGDLGPWLRGGPATVRGLDDAAGAAPLIGAGGQFGGNHPLGGNFALADGGVRFFTARVDSRVLYGLATIAGKGTDPLPGE